MKNLLRKLKNFITRPFKVLKRITKNFLVFSKDFSFLKEYYLQIIILFYYYYFS